MSEFHGAGVKGRLPRNLPAEAPECAMTGDGIAQRTDKLLAATAGEIKAVWRWIKRRI